MSYVEIASQYPVLSMRSHGRKHGIRLRLFIVLLACVIVMNALDGLLTVFWVSSDLAVESNPLMDLTLRIHPVLFMFVKLTLVYLGSFILLIHSEKMLAHLSLAIAFCAYFIVMFYHCSMIFVLNAT